MDSNRGRSEARTGSADPGSNRPPEVNYSLPITVGSLVAGVFLGGVGGGVAFPTLPTLGPILGISPFVVGVILSSNRFTRLLMNAPAGQMIDRYGPRKPMIFGLLTGGLAPFGYIIGLYPDSVPVFGVAEIFIVSRALWGIGLSLVFVGAFSTIVQITTEHNRGKWIGYFRGGQALGFPSGLILGAIVTDIYGFEAAFGIAGVAGLFAALVATVVLPDIDASTRNTAKLSELPAIVRADERIFAIGMVNLVVRLLFSGVLLATVVLYAQENGLEFGRFSGVGASGFIMAIAVLFSSGTTLLSGTISDRVSNRALISLPGLCLFAVGFVALGVVPTLVGTLVGVACIGIGVGGTNPPLLAYLGDISPGNDIGKVGGVYNVFGDVGSTLGPLVAIPVGARFGYRAEYIACAAFTMVALALVARTLLHPNERRPNT